MAGERAGGGSPRADAAERSDGQAENGGEVGAALARVQEAVSEIEEGGLRESLEGAIEAIDTAVRDAPDPPEGNPLNAVADALEEALEEVEKGKVANLLPVLEEAQTIVDADPSAES